MLYIIVCIDALTDRKSSFKQGAMPNLSATINNHTNIGPQSNPLFALYFVFVVTTDLSSLPREQQHIE